MSTRPTFLGPMRLSSCIELRTSPWRPELDHAITHLRLCDKNAFSEDPEKLVKDRAKVVSISNVLAPKYSGQTTQIKTDSLPLHIFFRVTRQNQSQLVKIFDFLADMINMPKLSCSSAGIESAYYYNFLYVCAL